MRGLGVERRVVDPIALLESSDDVEALERYQCALARADFWHFRKYIHPQLLSGWRAEETAHELQRFCEAFTGGGRPKAVFEPTAVAHAGVGERRVR